MSYIAQLRFTDLESAIDFYVDKLDCVVEFTYEDFYAGIASGDQLLHFKKVDEPEPNLEWVEVNQHLHVMFPVQDVESRHKQLEARGVAVSTIRNQPWGREFTVKDPGGHTLYITELS